jgi:alpha-amylase
MFSKQLIFTVTGIGLFILFLPSKAIAAEQPVAIFHAFNQKYADVEAFACTLAEQRSLF